MAQHAGSVADKRNGFAGSEERFDQLDRVLVFREIPHRTMAARIEDGVVVFLSDAVETQRLVELSFGVRVLLEPTRDVGLEARLVALGIKWRTAALRGCQGNPRARIPVAVETHARVT